MNVLRSWAVLGCAALLLVGAFGSDCHARGAKKPKKVTRLDPDQGEQGEERPAVEWSDFSGLEATKKARLLLFALTERSIDDIDFRRPDIVKEILKQEILCQVVYPPEDKKDRKALKEYRALCEKMGVKRLPMLVLLSPGAKRLAVFGLDSNTLLRALRLLPGQLKKLGDEEKPAAEGDKPKEGEGDRPKEGEKDPPPPPPPAGGGFESF